MVHLNSRVLSFLKAEYMLPSLLGKSFRNESVLHAEVLHRHTAVCRKRGSVARGDFGHKFVSNLGTF